MTMLKENIAMQDKVNINVVQYQIDLFQWAWEDAHTGGSNPQESYETLVADLFNPQSGAAGSSTVAPATYGLNKNVAGQILDKVFLVHRDDAGDITDAYWNFPHPNHLRVSPNPVNP